MHMGLSRRQCEKMGLETRTKEAKLFFGTLDIELINQHVGTMSIYSCKCNCFHFLKIKYMYRIYMSCFSFCFSSFFLGGHVFIKSIVHFTGATQWLKFMNKRHFPIMHALYL
jgi:hypothetical protein